MFKIGVFSIIFNGTKEILLCHRRDCDLWNLPGGGLELNESPWDGAVRETKEETGFEIKIDKLIGIYHKPKKNTVVFIFLGSLMGGKATLNEEADEIKFFSLNNLPQNLSEKHRKRIVDALTNSREVILKTQDSPDYFELK